MLLPNIASHPANPAPAPDRAGVEEIMAIFLLHCFHAAKHGRSRKRLVTAAARNATSDCFWLSSVQLRFDESQIIP
jgi:hypothetical protein